MNGEDRRDDVWEDDTQWDFLYEPTSVQYTLHMGSITQQFFYPVLQDTRVVVTTCDGLGQRRDLYPQDAL